MLTGSCLCGVVKFMVEGEFDVAWLHSIGTDTISIAMGALDAPTGTRLEKHIFVADKGDYYDIKDGLPQIPQ